MASPVFVHIANGQVSRYVLFMAMLYFMKVSTFRVSLNIFRMRNSFNIFNYTLRMY